MFLSISPFLHSSVPLRLCPTLYQSQHETQSLLCFHKNSFTHKSHNMVKEWGELGGSHMESIHLLPSPSIFSFSSLPHGGNCLILHLVSPQTLSPIFMPPLSQSTFPNRGTALLQAKSSGKIKTPPS